MNESVTLREKAHLAVDYEKVKSHFKYGCILAVASVMNVIFNMQYWHLRHGYVAAFGCFLIAACLIYGKFLADKEERFIRPVLKFHGYVILFGAVFLATYLIHLIYNPPAGGFKKVSYLPGILAGFGMYSLSLINKRPKTITWFTRNAGYVGLISGGILDLYIFYGLFFNR